MLLVAVAAPGATADSCQREAFSSVGGNAVPGSADVWIRSFGTFLTFHSPALFYGSVLSESSWALRRACVLEQVPYRPGSPQRGLGTLGSRGQA